ncbi:MAG: heavy-metal-associated domain-containing protein [Chloroflexota bacterium]
MSTVTYHIPSINCGHCVQTIKMEVGEIEGVQSVEVDPTTKQATISFDAPATEGVIKDLLIEINFPAVS